jgi:hypothetical protein
MQFTEYKWVKYHTTEWELLTELGYVTMTVDNNNMAQMLYHKGKF